MGGPFRPQGREQSLGVRLVRNSSSCTPELIELSPYFVPVKAQQIDNKAEPEIDLLPSSADQDLPESYYQQALTLVQRYFNGLSIEAMPSVALMASHRQAADNGFLQWVVNQAIAANIDLSKLNFHFRESDLCRSESSEIMLQGILDAGIGVYLVDVFVGGSFDILASPAVRFVELDRAFLDNYPSNPLGQPFFRGVNAVCTALGKQLAVDGVDCKEKWVIVRDLGIPLFKGAFAGNHHSSKI